MSLIKAEGLYAGYGGVDILRGTRLRVEADEIVVIVGPNGAGKSTAMKALFGLVPIREGQVEYMGEVITNRPAEQMASRGIAYVPQESNVFPSLSVLENLELGAYAMPGDLGPRLEKVFEIFPKLRERRQQAAGLMSGGERQMVAMGRALMIDPHLLMLDEPTAGLSPRLIDETIARIQEVNQLGIGVLMVEQNARQALAIANRGYVLATGENRYEDSGPALLANPEVAEMFLGG
ncbi:ABC transporter-like protein [Spiribacter salinus M19-40]|uniref:ABC transporter-like protein n=2 Tax=Spiribacter salinus TaxID=1335746 RepID=R4VIY6_9GAMM|nr:ABC transporter ATP-binding protein [Spiribacter salinus]MDR9413375.1 ABC transporter ATP-binding protein [Spiribacter sp.]AGM40547.1 ABC transporter-like protein [Spiribacter salinus M19-40]MBY5267776.1 ABC transporter ATP-binding protein [Spiribacter salinus]MDR9454331.1 ABC transporter ATP-binding protein [Spiribacter sp.]TQE99931.1 MAG: ABC transporter ATP-binding protein [Spiribacter salinus]